MVLVEVQYFGTAFRYGLETLHQCGKRVKTKSQKVLRANSYVCRSYRGKTGSGGGVLLASPPSPILNRVNSNNSEICNFILRCSFCLRSASAFGYFFSLSFDTFWVIFYFSLNVLLHSIFFSEEPLL